MVDLHGDWWPWTWFMCHVDDVAPGMACTWISRHEIRPGRITDVDRDDVYPHVGRIISIEAVEFQAQSTRRFTGTYSDMIAPRVAGDPGYRDAMGCGAFSLLVGVALPARVEDPRGGSPLRIVPLGWRR